MKIFKRLIEIFTLVKRRPVLTIINESSEDIAFSQEEREGKTVIEMLVK